MANTSLPASGLAFLSAQALSAGMPSGMSVHAATDADGPVPRVKGGLYPPIKPYRTGRLDVSPVHQLYYEECGNPDGVPVVFLHGGPGGGCRPEHRRFFDPQQYRIVLFDQRGCGRSTPLASVQQNTTAHLVSDIEQLRAELDIDQWLVFGGSWGSTLALAYGIAHPDACLGFVLRGVFLGSRAETEWFIQQMGQFHPEAWRQFAMQIPDAERGNLLQAYARRLFSDDPGQRLRAAKAWSAYETSCARLRPITNPPQDEAPDAALALAALECHYLMHNCFMPAGWFARGVHRIRHLPAAIIQGRYDVICPPSTAFDVAAMWPNAHLTLIDDAGHSAFESGIQQSLVVATDSFLSRMSVAA